MAAKTGSPIVSPLGPGAVFERVDQGVDYSQADPYKALGAGTVYAITGGFSGGTGKAVYVRLNKPVVVNGRSYQEIYYAETTPLVRVGQKVQAGQPIASGGGAELGFARGSGPLAPLVGGLGAGTQPTQAGRDYLAAVQNLGGPGAGKQTLLNNTIGTEQPPVSIPGVTPALQAANAKLGSAGNVALDATKTALGGWVGDLTGWLTKTGRLVLAYVLLVGVAAGLFLQGMKGLGVQPPKLPTVVPV